jgi:hypothetical protein
MSPRFARVISLLSLAFLILPVIGLGSCGPVAVEGRLRVVCFWGDGRPSLVEGLEAVVEGSGCGRVSRVHFPMSALRSIAGHKSSRYSSDEEVCRNCGGREPESHESHESHESLVVGARVGC